MIRLKSIAVVFILFVLILIPSAGAQEPPVTCDLKPEFSTIDPNLPKIVIVTTGGTIAEKSDPVTGGAVPTVSGTDLTTSVPQLKEIANIGVVDFCNIDSSHMTPEIWLRLSTVVDTILGNPDIRGLVITHGTDTMAEGAYFLELTLTSRKPVIFTGAMNDASSPFPDGPGNLVNAVAQVCSPKAENWGVTVTLNQYINSARNVRKTQTSNVQTFNSGECGYLGYIFGGKVIRYNERPANPKLKRPSGNLPQIPLISTYAGDDGKLVRFAADSGADGLVIEGVGAGNVNAEVYKAIQYALARDIPVVIATRVYHGAVEPVYGGEGGGKTLSDAGCILAGNLDGGKARLLLMLGLANFGPDMDALKAVFAY